MGGIVSSILGTSNNYQATAPTNGYRAMGANLDTSSYADAIKQALAAASAGTNGSSAAGDQASLAAALKAQMEGKGPSLAQQQLQQATQATAAQGAGQIASVKGLNPALAARMIVQGTAATNQQAANQSALIRSNEQLNSEGLLANALQAQRGQDINQQQANTSLAGTAGGLQNQQNATQVQNKLGAEQINQATAAQNANLKLGAQQINAGVAAQNANTAGGIVGGIMQGGGAALAALADGGEVPTAAEFAAALKVHRYAGGGSIDIPQIAIPDYSRMLSEAGDAMKGGLSAAGKSIGAKPPGGSTDPAGLGSPLESFQPAGSPTVAPWEGASPLLTAGVPFAAHGGAIDFRVGGKVPGRATVPGDSPKNDTVPAVVSPGEVVLPRSVTQAPDAAEKAAEFVKAIKAKKGDSGSGGYGKVLAMHRELAGRLARLEKRAEGGEIGSDEKPPPKKDEDEHAAGWNIADKINAALPAWLSGRDAVMKQRARMAALDAVAAGAN